MANEVRRTKMESVETELTAGSEDTPMTCIGTIPHAANLLTPELAAVWLENSSQAYHGLAAQAAKVAEGPERIAVGNLMYWTGEMVEACLTAIQSGEGVEIDSNLDKSGGGAPAETIYEVSMILRAAMRAAAIADDPRGDYCNLGGSPAAQELAEALAISSGHPLAEEAA